MTDQLLMTSPFDCPSQLTYTLTWCICIIMYCEPIELESLFSLSSLRSPLLYPIDWVKTRWWGRDDIIIIHHHHHHQSSSIIIIHHWSSSSSSSSSTTIIIVQDSLTYLCQWTDLDIKRATEVAIPNQIGWNDKKIFKDQRSGDQPEPSFVTIFDTLKIDVISDDMIDDGRQIWQNQAKENEELDQGDLPCWWLFLWMDN